MKPVIVSDAGPLIALAKIDHLGLLKTLFATIHIPEIVLHEATQKGPLADAILIREFANKDSTIAPTIDTPFSRQLRTLLDDGEVQALVLAKNLGCGVLMDEKRGRQVAKRHNIAVVGVLGLLLQARRHGNIANVKPFVDTLQSSGYRFSAELVSTVLKLAGEA